MRERILPVMRYLFLLDVSGRLIRRSRSRRIPTYPPRPCRPLPQHSWSLIFEPYQACANHVDHTRRWPMKNTLTFVPAIFGGHERHTDPRADGSPVSGFPRSFGCRALSRS